MQERFDKARDAALGPKDDRDHNMPAHLIPKGSGKKAGKGVAYERNKYAKSVNKKGVRCYTLATSSEPHTKIVAPCASGKMKTDEIPIPLQVRSELLSVSCCLIRSSNNLDRESIGDI